MKTAILINVGTPDSPEPEDVGRYLNEFLMDEDIVSIPRPLRDFLVKVLIVPRRKFSSSEKYKKIWTAGGSPLLIHSKAIEVKLQSKLGPQWRVLTAMQVGQPQLKEVLMKEASQGPIFVCPLYPQFAQATTGAALRVISQKVPAERVFELKPFYQASWFLEPVISKIKKKMKSQDHLLLSYHGLPVSQLKKKNPTCLQKPNCCDSSDLRSNPCDLNCYKAQCHRTSEAIQSRLGLESVSTSFQSRLGPAQWIGPSTEETVQNLARKGVKNLIVACPSFVADCLETLEEIALETQKLFLESGGESFQYVECVNDDDLFVEGLALHLESSAKRLR